MGAAQREACAALKNIGDIESMPWPATNAKPRDQVVISNRLSIALRVLVFFDGEASLTCECDVEKARPHGGFRDV